MVVEDRLGTARGVLYGNKFNKGLKCRIPQGRELSIQIAGGIYLPRMKLFQLKSHCRMCGSREGPKNDLALSDASVPALKLALFLSLYTRIRDRCPLFP